MLLSFLLSGFVVIEEKKPQTLCPVMGNKINKEAFVDYHGQRVYFCCGGCDKKFLENPEKYFAQFEKENILLENVQTVCPVMGSKINRDVYTDYEGRRVYFCCSGCDKKFLENPMTYLEKMNGVAKKEEKKKTSLKEKK